MNIKATDLTNFHRIANYASMGRPARIERVRHVDNLVIVTVHSPHGGLSEVVYFDTETVEVA